MSLNFWKYFCRAPRTPPMRLRLADRRSWAAAKSSRKCSAKDGLGARTHSSRAQRTMRWANWHLHQNMLTRLKNASSFESRQEQNAPKTQFQILLLKIQTLARGERTRQGETAQAFWDDGLHRRQSFGYVACKNKIILETFNNGVREI